jgi:hypothetical protein
MAWFADMNGYMILCFSEVLAIVPYLLRSLRIQKMFKAREIYARTDSIPKRMIWKWREVRIIKIFLICLMLLVASYMAVGYLCSKGVLVMTLPNYFALSSPMHMDGLMTKD